MHRPKKKVYKPFLVSESLIWGYIVAVFQVGFIYGLAVLLSPLTWDWAVAIKIWLVFGLVLAGLQLLQRD